MKLVVALIADIMLVKLSGTSGTVPMEMNFDPQFPPDGVDAKVIGYGATSEGGSSSFVLQEALIPIVPYGQCDSFWNKLDAITQICTGNLHIDQFLNFSVFC